MKIDSFKREILKNRKVSIWGVGYLGYTSILTLQRSGFRAAVYDFNEARLTELEKGRYPSEDQLNSWTKLGKMPEVNLDYVDIVRNRELLFENKIHLISFSNSAHASYIDLARYFVKNKDRLRGSLVVFQSAGRPNDIDSRFNSILNENGIEIDIATVFRGDWVIEEFLEKNNYRVVSSNNEKASSKVMALLSSLNLREIALGSIKEAEVYENAKISLNYTVNAFFNQLSLSFPDVNMNNVARNVLRELDQSVSIGVSSVDYKTEQSIDNLLGSSDADCLSILKEANNTNISFLYYYIEILKSKKINSVSILGLSSCGKFKDFRFSPSVILTDYLTKEGLEVYVYDENITKDELSNYLPAAKFVDINNEKVSSDVVVMLNLSDKFKFMTQYEIERIGLTDAKYILDNTGFFESYSYGDGIIYHCLGDGNLIDIMSA